MKSRYIALATASLLLLGAGCVPSPVGFIKDAVGNKINREIGEDGSVNFDDDSVSFTDDDGTTSSFGDDVSIPDNFPSDVPIPDDSTVVGVAVTPDQGSWATFTTDLSVDEVTSWYDDELSSDGWESTGTYSSSGMSSQTYSKDGLTISLLVTEATDDTPTTVVVTETAD